MKAKEMWEKLGYEYHQSTQGLAYTILCKMVFEDGSFIQFLFNHNKVFHTSSYGGIEANELEACYQTMKELGWL